MDEVILQFEERCGVTADGVDPEIAELPPSYSNRSNVPPRVWSAAATKVWFPDARIRLTSVVGKIASATTLDRLGSVVSIT